MIGLAYLGFFVLYLLITILVVWWAYRFAKRKYQKGWIGALCAFLVMYHLVFWDLIPVLVMHKYYCSTQAGYWVYKTPEEWVDEHPEVWGQDWSDSSKWERESSGDYRHSYRKVWISRLLYYVSERDRDFAHAITKRETELKEASSEKLLFKYVDFEIGSPNLFVSGSHIKGYSIWKWIYGGKCNDSESDYQRHFYQKYQLRLINLVKTK